MPIFWWQGGFGWPPPWPCLLINNGTLKTYSQKVLNLIVCLGKFWMTLLISTNYHGIHKYDQLIMILFSMWLTQWVSLENGHYFCCFSWINDHDKYSDDALESLTLASPFSILFPLLGNFGKYFKNIRKILGNCYQLTHKWLIWSDSVTDLSRLTIGLKVNQFTS